MLRATTVEPGGSRQGMVADRIVLDFDARYRRRIALTSEGGLSFLLDLASATVLRNGDALVLDDGRQIEVVAAREPLAEIRCREINRLLRIVWHLGNRHLPVVIGADRLLIRRDHVIEDMVRGLGATVTHIAAPFDPEGGAYPGGGHTHGDAHE